MRDLNLGASSPERGAADCEPLPCPFCGRAPEQFDRASDHTASGHIWFLACMGDGYSAHAHQHGDTRAEVVAKWNRRASVVPTGDAPLDCRSETGETVALADAAIIILRLLSRRDLSIGPVRAALSDLRSDREVSNILWPPDEASVNAH